MNAYEKLLYSLGGFVLQFADTERAVLDTLTRLSGVPEEVGKALFSGTRGDSAISLIYRLLEVRNDSHASKANQDRFKYAFDQFKAINEARNLILHHGFKDKASVTPLSTNERVALTQERLRSLRVTPELLDGMTSDLAKIEYTLAVNAITKGRETPSDWEAILRSLREPWRYTSPAQSTPRASSNQKRKNTPASGEK
ncbi:MAG TPA: hypothetical protein VFA39_19055 [Steroidobacteraceae bacterium]|nr:hypothetical protein [Steroidobacteraceae bacterium]